MFKSRQTTLILTQMEMDAGFQKRAQSSSFAEMKRLVPCAVCQKSSSGCHYGVFSCGGCRNFFKRSLKNHETYKCDHSVAIPIEKCKMCRFNACLRAGMSIDAMKIGRPTHREKTAISSYLRRLSHDQDGPSHSNFQLQMKADSNELLNKFQQRLLEAAQRFHQGTTSNKVVPPIGSHSQVICDLIKINLEQDIANVGNLFRSMPGFTTKVTMNQRIFALSKAVFPILVLKSLKEIQPNSTALSSFFSLDQDTIKAVYKISPFDFHQLEYILTTLKVEFEMLQITELESALIYPLLLFDVENISQNCDQEQPQNFLSLVQVYSSVNETLMDNNRRVLILDFVRKLQKVRLPISKLLEKFSCQTTIFLSEIVKFNLT